MAAREKARAKVRVVELGGGGELIWAGDSWIMDHGRHAWKMFPQAVTTKFPGVNAGSMPLRHVI